MLLREIERREGAAVCLATCVEDPRAPAKVQHSLEEIIRFRILVIAADYQDASDAADLRHDPSFKLALERAVPRLPTLDRRGA